MKAAAGWRRRQKKKKRIFEKKKKKTAHSAIAASEKLKSAARGVGEMASAGGINAAKCRNVWRMWRAVAKRSVANGNRHQM
jgi:hypothetical protein